MNRAAFAAGSAGASTAAHRRRRRRRHKRRHRRAAGAGLPPRPSQRLLDAHRLLWRAGFGPRPGEAEALAGLSRQAAVYSLTRPDGEARLVGPPPHTQRGAALAPTDLEGHDHLWWLDRMVRSDQPLVERMTLNYHDWFATSNDKVDSQKLMLDQNGLLRSHALGSFAELFKAITVDPAMLVWLDGRRNHARRVNENYGREMMELFSLGADRGAYSETDVREQARSLSGFTSASSDKGESGFRYVDSLHDAGRKSVFGQAGRFTWEDSVRLCLEHPLHPSFYVTKLWGYFNPVAPDAAAVDSLSRLYVQTGYSTRAVLEQILLHPSFYSGPAMTKPPVVHAAGMLRGLGSGVRSDHWVDLAEATTQRLFHPPDVSGWRQDRWLDTSTFKGRWDAAGLALGPHLSDGRGTHMRVRETPAQAVGAALRALGRPPLSAGTLDYLVRFAGRVAGKPHRRGVPARVRSMRHNALRQLILTAPDYHTC
jgi:hypothetical protein